MIVDYFSMELILLFWIFLYSSNISVMGISNGWVGKRTKTWKNFFFLFAFMSSFMIKIPSVGEHISKYFNMSSKKVKLLTFTFLKTFFLVILAKNKHTMTLKKICTANITLILFNDIMNLWALLKKNELQICFQFNKLNSPQTSY